MTDQTSSSDSDDSEPSETAVIRVAGKNYAPGCYDLVDYFDGLAALLDDAVNELNEQTIGGYWEWQDGELFLTPDSDDSDDSEPAPTIKDDPHTLRMVRRACDRKMAHEYAAVENVDAWVLVDHAGRMVGRIVALHTGSRAVATVYRYTQDATAWGVDDCEMIAADGSPNCSDVDVYTTQALDHAVRVALRHRGVTVAYDPDDPWRGADWRRILEDHGIRTLKAI
jgi:hypothetical protein